uniref:Uncharacterized protein n=1 Tax=Rhipicephalus zambeziensis TaxID=60191 RepID=A0A224YKG5_9ACAR
MYKQRGDAERKEWAGFFSRSPRLCHGREHRNKEIVLIGNGKNAEAPCLLHSFGFFRVSPRQVAERAAKQLLDREKKNVVLRKQSFHDSCTSCQTRHRSRQT